MLELGVHNQLLRFLKFLKSKNQLMHGNGKINKGNFNNVRI